MAMSSARAPPTTNRQVWKNRSTGPRFGSSAMLTPRRSWLRRNVRSIAGDGVAGNADGRVDLVSPGVPAGLRAAGEQFEIWSPADSLDDRVLFLGFMRVVLEGCEHPGWLGPVGDRCTAAGTEKQVLGGIAQVLAQPEARLDPGEGAAWGEAPRLHDVVAGAQGGIGDPEPQVGVVLGQVGDGHRLDAVEGQQVVVLDGPERPLLLDVPRRVGQDGLVFLGGHDSCDPFHCW